MNKHRYRHNEHNLIPYIYTWISQVPPAYLDPFPFIRFSEDVLSTPPPTIWTPIYEALKSKPTFSVKIVVMIKQLESKGSSFQKKA